jgi:pilus assembly protein Flp/PilA
MTKFFNDFLRDESGASAAEYALILAIVGVGIGAAALALGANVKASIVGASDDVYDCNHSTQGEIANASSVICWWGLSSLRPPPLLCISNLR